MKSVIGRVIGSGIGAVISSLMVLSASGMCPLDDGGLENPSFETGDATGWANRNQLAEQSAHLLLVPKVDPLHSK